MVAKVEVCDVCGNSEGVSIWRISRKGDGSMQVAVCENRSHGAPKLQSLMEAAEKARPKTTHPGPKTRVYTMDEVIAARITNDTKAKKGRKRP